MIKKIIIISSWLILLTGLGILLGFVEKENQSQTCNKLDILIKYNSNDYFITADDINTFLAVKGFKIKGAPLSNIDEGKIEIALQTIPYVENADIFQKRAIVKVYNKYGQQFYIDNKGKLMPSSDKYTAHLPVANGYINDLYNPFTKLEVSDSASADTVIMATSIYKIFRIAQFLDKDDFWKAMVEEIFINSKSDIELFTKIGEQTVIIGNIDNMEEKFENLLVFYKQELNKIGWRKYKTINLKYKNQVVCSKI